MQQAPHYADVVSAVGQFFGEVLERLVRAGVAPEQVVLDVGLGFGKSLEHNLQLLARLDGYRKWGRPLLIGASRKSLIQQLLGTPLPERLPASLACVCWSVGAGAHLLRTHDVAATVQAVRMFEAIIAHQH